MKSQVFFLLFFPVVIFAQDNSWGIGVLKMPFDSKVLIDVYDMPNGTREGKLGRKERQDAPGESVIIWRDIKHGGYQMHILTEVLIAIGYEINGLVIHEVQNGF